MECIAVIGVAALAAWGVSVERRCLNAFARTWLIGLSAILTCLLIAAALVGGRALVIALVSCLAAVAVVEALMMFRVIPSVHGFRRFFQHLPLDLRIIAAGGREIYRTNIARRLDNSTLWSLASKAAAAGRDEVLATRVESMPHTALKLYQLPAGVAMLAEDTTEIDELHAQAKRQGAELLARNDLLRKQQVTQSQLHGQRRERELYACVERDLADTARHIASLLDELVAEDADAPGSDAAHESAAHRKEQLNLIKVLVAYSKRKGMLALAGAESPTMESAELEVIAREAMADLRSIGIECAVLVNATKPMAMNAVNTIYDSFYDCIICVLSQASPVIMVSITQNANAALQMRVTIECALGLDWATAAETIPEIATSNEAWAAIQSDMAHDLERRLALRGGDFSIAMEDGLVTVCVSACENADEETAATSGEGDAEVAASMAGDDVGKAAAPTGTAAAASGRSAPRCEPSAAADDGAASGPSASDATDEPGFDRAARRGDSQ